MFWHLLCFQLPDDQLISFQLAFFGPSDTFLFHAVICVLHSLPKPNIIPYICQRQGYASYGKSICRADVEGAFDTVLKQMTPSKEVVNLAWAMLKDQWSKREEIQNARAREYQKILAEIEHKIKQSST